MKNTYKLARPWQSICFAGATGAILLWLLIIFGNGIQGTTSDFITISLLMGGLAAVMLSIPFSCKIITSPTEIIIITLGLPKKISWGQVEKVAANEYAVINLFFKESLSKNRLMTALLRPMAYDRIVQLSPYLADIAHSPLLNDIKTHAPHCIISAEITKARSYKPFQQAGNIAVYYFIVLMTIFFFTFLFYRILPSLWAQSGLKNVPFIFELAIISGIISVFYSGFTLIHYQNKTAKMDEAALTRTAVNYYLAPLVGLIGGFVFGLAVWIGVQTHAITLGKDLKGFRVVALLIGSISLKLIEATQKIFFRRHRGIQ